ncbi:MULTISPECIES: M13 family metallopeptidase [unclassified Janthinobacterium]|uniref:M13 family metallopeptidase n=1 Tax=unclassified Janthinobacterium TaxID=2610881 RepID=UPI00088757BB|nr:MULTISPECIES: M13-type metalloendopeptidase [unclassified Janthinobacterium]SDA68054.1 Predicted metalloendopeptidase [Janthinobacterium sp. 551a]SFB50912.1 Predicted metalloendopeptidase [Janthinobacterium sp. 344]
MNRYLLSALTLSLLAGVSGMAGAAGVADTAKKAVATTAAAPAGLTSGIAVEYINPAVRAQDDLFQHLNGKWLAETVIPADKSSWGSFAKLADDTQTQLRGIVEGAAADKARAAGSNAQKIGDFYNSFMDEAKLESLGLTPLNGEMAKIAALQDKAELPAVIAHFSKLGVTSPYDFGIHQDAKDSTKYVADIGQSGLGLPDRDYYLEEGKADTRAKYLAHVEKMLSLAGDANAAANAKAIVALETELAKAQWSNVQNRDPVKTYNKVELAKLADVAPGYDWARYLKDTGIAGKVNYVIVSQPSYLKGFAEIANKTPLETWKAYFQWHLLHANAGYLPKAFVDENFAFYGTTLTGVTEMRPRWKRGVGAVEGALGEAVGQLYVEQYFPAERKVRMEALVKNLMTAYKQSIDKLDWMSPVTKKQAQIKLAKFTTKIGYPNKWRDYSGLDVAPDDLVGNIQRSHLLNYNRELNKLGQPIDRDEWGMTPQTVNAYYNPELNEIVFPAAILQAPFFDANADDAVNYGAIGGVIGHEISHGFDDQGAQYDGDGNLRDWWTKADHKNFAKKTKQLVAQYNSFSPVPGHFVNGELTLGENIADNSGVAIAYKAYKLSLNGKKAPVIDGFTGEQRFYAGFAQVWRMKMREAQQLVLLKTDPHSPGQFRANGTMRNQPGFYQAFDVKPGDKMYLPPKDRVIMW